MFNQYSSLSDLAIIMSICKYCFAPYGPLIGFGINIQTYNHHSQLIPQIIEHVLYLLLQYIYTNEKIIL